MMSLPWSGTSMLLELDLTEPPADPSGNDPLTRLRSRGRRLLRPTLRALHEAGNDRRVRGLIIKVGGSLPWATMQELRIGLLAFRESGKPVVAWAESFDDTAGLTGYTLATAADEIWLQPGGGVGLLGVGIQATFLRGVLDRIGIEPQFEQRHEYKNAPDQLVRTELSEAHRESLERVTASIFDDAVGVIGAARDLPSERVRELVDTGPRTATEAHDVGLVDRLGYRDEAYAAVRDTLGEVTLLFADRWSPRPRLPQPRRRHVALVEVRGGIAPGRSRRGPMGQQCGSDTVSTALRAAAADDRAAAVLLKVDSPGGSAVASEVIWREVTRVQEAGKPVIVSMGSVAASGGYYVSASADVIVALPATLTGSIGVFSGKLVATEALDRIGVGTDTVQRGAHALMYSGRRGFSDSERERLAATVDAIYDDFVGKVAAGRRRPFEEIEPLARGRVWTGRDAYERGLVDELGGLRDALRIARERGGLPDDAPVVLAGQLPAVARLGRPKNSEDPRAAATGLHLPTLATLTAELTDALRMPPFRLR